MQIEHDEKAKRFNLMDDDGTKMGEIEYMKGGNNELYATRTEIFPEFEGKGYARYLLDALVEWAVGRESKIIPTCPYVVAAFKKYPEKYAAVIK